MTGVVSDILPLGCIIVASHCACFYSYHCLNTVGIPIIRHNLHVWFTGFFVRVVLLIFLYFLILKGLNITPTMTNKIQMALIIGVFPDGIPQILHLLIPLLTGTEKYKYLRKAIILLIGRITKEDSWIENLRLSKRLIGLAQFEIRRLWLKISNDENQKKSLNRCFEKAKKDETDIMRMWLPSFIYRMVDLSKKFHYFLEWYKWKLATKMLKNPPIFDDWDGEEGRKEAEDHYVKKRRFYEKEDLNEYLKSPA